MATLVEKGTTGNKMRLLIYGMQSSGASTLAMILAQKPMTSAFVDIWTMFAAPALPGEVDVVAKVVVTTAFPLALHQERFQPDRTLLLLRHPVVNYRSLAAKTYRHHCGFMEEKFAILDEVFGQGARFDGVVHYEDLVFDPLGTLAEVSKLGWPCDSTFLRLARSHRDIVAFNNQRFPFLGDRLQYGSGNYRGGYLKTEHAGLTDLSDASPVAEWCPRIIEHYRRLMEQKRTKWRESTIEVSR